MERCKQLAKEEVLLEIKKNEVMEDTGNHPDEIMDAIEYHKPTARKRILGF